MTFCLFAEEGWGEVKISPCEGRADADLGALSGRHQSQEVAGGPQGPRGAGPALGQLSAGSSLQKSSLSHHHNQAQEKGTAISCQTFQAPL